MIARLFTLHTIMRHLIIRLVQMLQQDTFCTFIGLLQYFYRITRVLTTSTDKVLYAVKIKYTKLLLFLHI